MTDQINLFLVLFAIDLGLLNSDERRPKPKTPEPEVKYALRMFSGLSEALEVNILMKHRLQPTDDIFSLF